MVGQAETIRRQESGPSIENGARVARSGHRKENIESGGGCDLVAGGLGVLLYESFIGESSGLLFTSTIQSQHGPSRHFR